MSIARRIVRYRLAMNSATCVLAGVWLGWAGWQMSLPRNAQVVHVWMSMKSEASCCGTPTRSIYADSDQRAMSLDSSVQLYPTVTELEASR